MPQPGKYHLQIDINGNTQDINFRIKKHTIEDSEGEKIDTFEITGIRERDINKIPMGTHKAHMFSESRDNNFLISVIPSRKALLSGFDDTADEELKILMKKALNFE